MKKDWINYLNVNDMKSTLIGLFLILLNVQFSFAQYIATEQEIINLSKEKWQWMADKNVKLLGELFHDKAKFVHMGGTWGKEREIDIIESGNIHYKKADIYEVNVDVVGDTAVLYNRITLLAVVGENEVTNPFMVTEVYKNLEGEWKLLTLAFSRLMRPN